VVKQLELEDSSAHGVNIVVIARRRIGGAKIRRELTSCNRQ
jgi:hypothetical protein